MADDDTLHIPLLIESEKIETLPRLIEVLFQTVNRLPLQESTKKEVVKIMICDMLQSDPAILENYLSRI
ncbi:MAG: hypothetical protein NTZ49_05510 [Candidatus Parcubacteria bacterium]|nr:hypothetical protein [Candidatus Parcubacteria bacterium]